MIRQSAYMPLTPTVKSIFCQIDFLWGYFYGYIERFDRLDGKQQSYRSPDCRFDGSVKDFSQIGLQPLA